MYCFSPSWGMGDTLSTAVTASPFVSLLNLTQNSDMTNGGSWRVGDSYRLTVGNVGKNLPVSLNGSTVGTTGDAGIFMKDGTVSGSESQTWSVPAGAYDSLNLAGITKTVKITVSGSPAASQVSPCFSLLTQVGSTDSSPCFGPLSQTTWLFAGIGLAAMLLFGGKR